MINNKNNNDDFLKDIIQKSDIESPSVNFTDNVMNQIQMQEQTVSQLSGKTAGIKNYFFLIAAGLAAVMYAVYYFISNDISLLPNDFDPILIPVFGKILTSMKELFQSIQISSFTLVIIVAVVGLFIIDRLLRKFQTGKQSYFSFFA
ncbi:MAG: hypothetical protein K8R86_01745 [Bacteroidales bacterium]|nr:hypothetical protein [Bacteroidales bacterium]